LIGICPVVKARSDWKLVTLTFDLESYFRSFSIQAICFEWLDLATSFSVWKHIFKISRSQFSFKVMVQGQGYGGEKAIASNSKILAGNCWDLIGISVTIMLEVIWSL